MAVQKEDRLDNAIMVILTTIVCAILVAYLAIPVISDAIASLTGDAAQYADLFSIVIVVMIVSMIILIVRGFNRGGR